MIPLYIVEEHHEVFYVWNRAVAEGFLLPFGNTLLHVDHHSDFECGAYATNWSALFSSLEDIHVFTYECLGVADFICPAIYQGMFNDIVFLHNFSGDKPIPEEMILSMDTSGCLTVEKVSALSRLALTKPGADHRIFTYSQGGLGDYYTPQALVLDIDLDYFCWDNSLSSVANKRLEITECAYSEMIGNPYNPFRLFPKAWLRAVEEDGRFYLSYLGLPDPLALPGEELCEKRLDLFACWLRKNRVTPHMISVCRSRYSGYTPQSLWEEIESGLLKRLREVYEYEAQD